MKHTTVTFVWKDIPMLTIFWKWVEATWNHKGVSKFGNSHKDPFLPLGEAPVTRWCRKIHCWCWPTRYRLWFKIARQRWNVCRKRWNIWMKVCEIDELWILFVKSMNICCWSSFVHVLVLVSKIFWWMIDILLILWLGKIVWGNIPVVPVGDQPWGRW